MPDFQNFQMYKHLVHSIKMFYNENVLFDSTVTSKDAKSWKCRTHVCFQGNEDMHNNVETVFAVLYTKSIWRCNLAICW